MPAPELTPVAIIGMACRLPGAANLEDFWSMLSSGRNALGPAAADRFDRSLYLDRQRGVPGKSYTDLAGQISYVRVERGSKLLPDELAVKFDVAHVALCETAIAACRHAGLDPAAIPQRNAGVYVGHASASRLASDLTYATYVAETAGYLREAAGFAELGRAGEEIIRETVARARQGKAKRNADGSPFLGASVASALIARTLGLSGPCMSFNAACASSLYALTEAVRALQHGRVDMAVVGGASYFTSDTLVLFSQAQSLSVSGSRPFTSRADGMVVGEGNVVMLLKTLPRAQADRDRILAVIPSVGISSDGHGRSLWAPRSEGQVEAIRRAYGPHVSAQHLQYIEAHATSTPVGDLTEIRSLQTALQGLLPPGEKIPIGSVKFNVGHSLEAAGLAGLLKTVLCLQNKTVPPSNDGSPLNPGIDWDQAPFFVPSSAIAWPEGAGARPRRAAVDSFGIGGLNAHVVVDEYLPPRNVVAPSARIPRASPASAAEDAVAIVGRGAILPGARTVAAFGELLHSGRDAKVDVPPQRWQTGLFFGPESAVPKQRLRGGFIIDYAYDWRKHRIPPKQIASASPLQFMILDAVDQALAEAGLPAEQFDRKQTAVVVGTVFGGDFSSQLVMGLRLPEFRRTLAETLHARGVPGALVEQLSKSYAAVLLKHMPALVDETGSFTASALASRVTSVFDFMGGAFAVDASTASSLAALNCAVDLLLTRTVGMVACVGAQQDMTPDAFEAASLSGKLARGNGRAPFDAQARGTFPAEGCGVLLLKRLSEARQHGNRVFGIIRGVGGGTGPTHRDAIGIAIRRAIDDAKTRPGDVSFVETSGTGLAAPDVQEAQAVSESYGATARGVPVLLSTVVGQLGHAGGASGMVSVLKATLALDEQKLPAVAGLVGPPPVVSQDARRLQLPAAECNLPLDDQQSRLLAGVTSCGELELVYHVVMERGTEMVQPLNKPAKNGDSLSHVSQAARGAARIVEFDATARRREKMRQKGLQPAERQPAETVGKHRSNGSATAEVGNAAHAGNAGPAAAHFLPQEPPRAANLRAGMPVETMSAPAFPSPSAAPAMIDVAELQLFLVNFVVEQTGYPPEIVSLDADLEADLGIDSIKKAQLFAEIGEHFQVAAEAGLTLDQFATLRHVSDYLIERIGAPHAATVPAAATSSSAVATAATVAAIDAGELQLFLVNFVVEQTGYPPEIVSLDADLEADLGIDSIKKAQLFAEIGEHFQVAAEAGLTLDQFATLRHVSDYLIERMGRPAMSAAVPAADPSSSSVPVATAAAAAIDAGELQLFLVNFVVEQTGYPPEIVNLDADLEADLGIDSIKKAQLFAEIGEHFQIAADAGLTLDQFATLRHVSDYLIGRLSGTPSGVGRV